MTYTLVLCACCGRRTEWPNAAAYRYTPRCAPCRMQCNAQSRTCRVTGLVGGAEVTR